MDNTKEKYAKNPYFWKPPRENLDRFEETQIIIEQMAKDLEEIKRILYMERDDGK